MPSGQVVAATLSSGQLLQSDKIGSLAYNNASWISIAQKNLQQQQQDFGPFDCFEIYNYSPEFELDIKQNSLQIHIVLWGEHRNRKEFHEMLSQCFQLDSYKAPVKCECIL